MYAKNIILATGMLCFINVFAAETSSKEENAGEDSRTTFSDNFLTLGTEEGEYGGENFVRFDRDQIKNQIKTFIPPLLRPAVTQHAYVLPPKTFNISTTQRFMSIKGDDFFKDGKENTAVFRDFEVNRQLTDLDIFYGFDFDKKYLHSFTLRVNVPYRSSQTDGSVNPNGQQFINLEAAGSTQGIGDVGLFLKKKVIEQGRSSFGIAVVGAVFLPTGSNNDTYGSRGRITATRPQPPNTTAAQGFDAVMQARTNAPGESDPGKWNDKRCFFSNFNKANFSGACNGIPEFTADGDAVQSFSPGGANAGNVFVGDFPFNNGVFGRFAGDGRLPSTLQPGVGKESFLLGVFATRQYNAASFVGRSSLHLGLIRRFLPEVDGIDYGDTTTMFASFVKPVYKDFLAVDLSFIGFDKENDSYPGKIPEPEIHACTQDDVTRGVPNCTAVGTEIFRFEIQDRQSFSGGFTGFLTPSLIFSPDPQLRASISTLIRIIEPDLGPAPDLVLRASLDYTF